jgi:hypothetical protein
MVVAFFPDCMGNSDEIQDWPAGRLVSSYHGAESALILRGQYGPRRRAISYLGLTPVGG